MVDGERAVARVHARGTHRGDYLGYRPTGLPVEFTEMIMFRIADGRIVEWWVEGNQLRIVEKVGGPAFSDRWRRESTL